MIPEDWRLKLLQQASRDFLTEPLPDDWQKMTDEQQDEFLLEHVWFPLEGYSARDIWGVIESSAHTLKLFIRDEFDVEFI